MVGLFQTPASAEVPDVLEPDYSQAVIDFNAKEYKKAIQSLDDLLKKNPGVIEFLELKALSQKSANQDKEALKTYVQLIQTQRKNKKPAKEIAPYHFELGIIQYRNQQLEPAIKNFAYALNQGFNPEASAMYLGITSFQKKENEAAIGYFKTVMSGTVEELKTAAAFYLGQVHLAQKSTYSAIENFQDARNRAETSLRDPKLDAETKQGMPQQIFDATSKVLEPYDRSLWFGSLSTLLGYDSNVTTEPPNSSQSSTGTSNSSLKLLGSFNVGYMTPSLHWFQWVPSYRFSGNYNTNKDVREYQFASNVLSMFFNFQPLYRLSYGLKTEGTLTFKNKVERSGKEITKSELLYFNRVLSAGPYARYWISPKIQAFTEITADSSTYKADTDLKKTTGYDARELQGGLGYTAKTGVNLQTNAKNINPQLTIKLGGNGADGDNNKTSYWGVDLSNSVRLNDQLSLNPTLTYLKTNYSKRSDLRADQNWVLLIPGTYSISSKLNLLASIQYTSNTSTVPDSYSYKRVEISSGASLSF